MPLTVQSVHVPSSLPGFSVRGGGRKKYYTTSEIEAYAREKGITFVKAFRQLYSEQVESK